MRNLKKILALVLALVMSLSLMATAGATEFKDDEQVSDTYRQAVDVLSELGVFNGDQNGNFNPTDPIRRSEVAAILYRIATGDIGLEGNKTYAPYNQFPDVTSEDWFAGYVTYCANAGYIKGRNTGKFDAKDNVTGYEVLAMILRAVGYDKNNEFVGSDWQLHTASIAREKGVLVNVLNDTDVQLSQPATRQVVAELLFRASLLPQVTWNAATLSYVDNGETLAYENLGMEQVEGVVVANEWADLRDDDVVAADTTVLKTADGERTLAVGTDLTDIGESRYAYVVGTKVLAQLEDTGSNVTKDCVELDPQGKATSVGALADNLSVKGAEYFLNFSDYSYDKSDYRIEYSISFRTQAAQEWFEARYLGDSLETLRNRDNTNAGRDPKDVEYLNVKGDYYQDANGNTDSTNKTGRTYSRVIPAGDTITNLDKDIMRGIFGSAASFDSAYEDFSKLSEDIIHAGYVYAGSKSNPNTADRKDDLSDDRTYKEFEDEYIGITAGVDFTGTTNGVWLKVIDNNDDGTAEYVLATLYDLVEVDSYNERTDAYYFSNNADTDDYAYRLRDGEYEFGVGDMLLVAWIDGQMVIEEAESEILVIDKYSWKDLNVTTRDGDVKYESGTWIGNLTGYADDISAMNYGVEYEVFYDHYGFIRAYRPVDSDRKYGLLTDLYLDDQYNTHFIRNQIATAELSFLDENGKLDMKEYQVANHDGYTIINPFVGVRQYVNAATQRTDNLQRAIAHLDMDYSYQSGSPRFWDNPTVNNTDGWYANSTLGNEFDYDGDPSSVGQNQSDTDTAGPNSTPGSATTDTNIEFSKTNVARYTINEDGTATLNTAAEYAYDKAGNQLFYWKNGGAFGGTPVTNGVDTANAKIGGERATASDWRTAYVQSNGLTDDAAHDKAAIDTAMDANLVPVYAVDYVMLDKTNNGASSIGSGTYRFKIDDSYDDTNNLYNWHVNAVSDTVFYVVTDDGVFPYVGYKNLPTISTTDITAMYAVAQNVTQDSASTDYWVADVVVIEVPALASAYGHMIYNVYDNYRQNQRGVIHEMNVIDCQTGEVTTAVVDSSWNQPYDTGFYLLQNAETAEDGTITATGMIKVEKHKASPNSYTYANYGIHAGEVVRSNSITSRDSYIEVFDAITDDNVNGDETRVVLNGAPWYSIHGYYTEANKSAGRFTATQLSDRDYTGNQPNGDEVIYVTYGGKVVFVIDTNISTGRYEAVPAYLNDFDGEKVYEGTDVYDVAMNEQTGPSTVTGDGKIKFTANFKQYINGSGEIVDFPVPAETSSFDVTTSSDGTARVVINLTNIDGLGHSYIGDIPSDYDLLGVVSADADSYAVNYNTVSNVITVIAVDGYDLRDGFTLNLVFEYDEANGTTPPIKAKALDESFAVPAADWQIVEMKETTNSSSIRSRSGGTNPQPGNMVDLYFTVKDTYKVESVTINAPADIKGVYDTTMMMGKVDLNGDADPSGDYVKYYITFKLPEGVVDLTINVANDDVNIAVPEGVSVDFDNTDVVKGESLDTKVIALTADANYSLPETVTVKVGGRDLTATTDYVYDKDAGTITFTDEAGIADGDIIVTGTAARDTITLTITGNDVENVVVKKGETVVPNAGRGSWEYTLDVGDSYSITVTPKAVADKFVSNVTATNDLSFTAVPESTDWKATLTAASSVSSAVTVTYDDVPVESKLTVTLADDLAGAAVAVVQGGDTIEEGVDGKYAVMTGSTITVTVTPATGRKIMGSATVSGATPSIDATTSVVTLTVAAITKANAATGATVSIGAKYFPETVTVDGKTVSLTVANDRSKAEGTVTISVAASEFSDESGSGSGPWTWTKAISASSVDGANVELAGDDYSSGSISLSENTEPTNAVETTLTVTVTPN